MAPLVSIVMGSKSDWETMAHAAQTLTQLGIAHEVRVVSAHRTPDLLFDYAASAESRGIEVIIAGAGGAAHLPGMTSSKTTLPVLGVPVESKALHGVDSLLSIVQMPAGVPVATFAIGKSGASAGTGEINTPSSCSAGATTGLAVASSPSDNGANRSVQLAMVPLLNLDAEHAGEEASSFVLADLLEVGDKGDDVAAPVAGREVRPASRPAAR